MDQNQQPGVEKEASDLLPLLKIRRIQNNMIWYYNVVDVIGALTGSTDPSDYWTKMKQRSKTEGFETTLQKVIQFPMKSLKDGKLRQTDCADRETLLRIIQSIPSASPRVEELKLWLAQIGEEKLQEGERDPIFAQIEAVRQKYQKEGRDENWINDRISNLTGRNALTDQWKQRGAVQSLHFGLLTTILHRGALGVSPDEHREIKQLPQRLNPRDHMDRVELALLTLTEATSTAKHIENDSQGIAALTHDAQDAAHAGEIARKATEVALGRPVVTATNFLKTSKKRQKQLPQPQKEQISNDEHDTLF
ncbi:MAG: phage antirepressor protein [Ktedonobacteraceae bacterium]